MSSFINKAMGKIEATLDKNSNKNDNTQSGNYNTHANTAGSGVDPSMDSDLNRRNESGGHLGGYGNTQGRDQYSTTSGVPGATPSGAYGSNVENRGYDNPLSSNTEHRSGNLAERADLRADRDRDRRNDLTSQYGGVGDSQTHGDGLGQTGGVGNFGTSNTGYGDSTRTHTTGLGGTSAEHMGTRTHGERTAHGLPDSTGATSNIGYTGGSNTFDGSRSTNTGGPHNSSLANKLDPRTDSDFDSRGNTSSRVGGYGGQTGTFDTAPGGFGSDTIGSTGNTTGGFNTYDNTRSSNTGPHSSNLMNKVDPRVDYDFDNRGNPTSRVGGYGGQTNMSGSYNTTGEYGSGAGINAPGYGSGAARIHEATTTDHGAHGSHGMHGTHGTHGAHETRGSHGTHDTYRDDSFTPGSGNTQKTAGPHNSDMLNKLDPRVDSDLDGSKTYGGDRTRY